MFCPSSRTGQHTGVLSVDNMSRPAVCYRVPGLGQRRTTTKEKSVGGTSRTVPVGFPWVWERLWRQHT